MLDALVNRLRGRVRAEVECPFPERILNLCAARRLELWDVRWMDVSTFSCSLSRRDWRVLRLLTRKMECTVRTVKKEGVPFALGKLRRRQALALGLAACALALFFGSFFIWDFTVDGAVTVPEEKILRALEKNGVKFGTFGFSINGEDLRNRILLEIPELSWLTVNVSGCRAYVQVRERRAKPEILDRRAPGNVVAQKAGVVLKIRSLVGQRCVLPGTTVEAGDILISGVQDTDTFGARMTAAEGTVTARTWYKLTARVPLTAAEKVYTGETRTGYSLAFGTKRIKFYGNSSYSGATYDKIEKRERLSFCGIPLPVAAETETCRFYELQAVPVPPLAAEKEAGAFLTAYLETLLDGDGTVSSTLVTSRESGGALEVTLAAECVEQIGAESPLETQETDGAAVLK